MCLKKTKNVSNNLIYINGTVLAVTIIVSASQAHGNTHNTLHNNYYSYYYQLSSVS